MVRKVHAGLNNGNGNYLKKVKEFPRVAWRSIWKVGRDDPRRLIHAFKVGLALTIVSLLYLLEPLFKGIGQNSIWAVMTVVVVFEFTAGATLCKGLNRGLGTLLAGLLAFLIEYVADASGHILRAIFIGAAVFLIGAAATYVRFFPYIKKNYDYGVVIFMLTFNLITLSSFRVENVLKIAHERFYTIAIGCAVCLFMSLLVFPNWSGEDLHNSTAFKLEGLADSIQACVDEYFYGDTAEASSENIKSSEDPIYRGYKAVLDSKSTDETLTPRSVRVLFKDPCIRVAGEVTKALIELGNSIRNRRHCSPEILSDHLHEALQDLNTAIRSQPRLFLGANDTQAKNMLAMAAAQAGETKPSKSSLPTVKTDSSALSNWKSKRACNEQAGNKEPERKVLRHQLSKIAITSLEFSEALPFAAFASLLVEIVAKLDLVIGEVEELGTLASFKEYRAGDEKIDVKCEKPRLDVLENHLPSLGVE
ncbi:hypothetical protein AAHE18_01G101800 [Arachis hypogaea]